MLKQAQRILTPRISRGKGFAYSLFREVVFCFLYILNYCFTYG